MVNNPITGFFKTNDCIVRVTGPDSKKVATFLHGQFTNHILNLEIGESNYNLLLTQKGKVVTDLWVARDSECFWLLIPVQKSEIVVNHLKKLAPLSKINVDLETNLQNIHHVGANNHSPIIKKFETQTNRIGIEGFDLLCESNLTDEIPESVRETTRIEHGIPKLDVDFTEANLPQESRLDRALHFEKGCYLGQEIIARLHFKGHVNKLLVGLQSKDPIQVGDLISDGEKEIGKITSVTQSTKLQSNLALGYVPYTQAQVGNIFQTKSGNVQIRQL